MQVIYVNHVSHICYLPLVSNTICVSFFFRLAFGNESGLAIVDIVQKSCLLNLGTPDLYGK